MSNYLVSGIYLNENKIITHFMFHKELDNNEFGIGIKTTEQAVIKLFDAGHTFQSLIWNYAEAAWSVGENINLFIINNERHIKTHKNNIPNDNLENMPNLGGSGSDNTLFIRIAPAGFSKIRV